MLSNKTTTNLLIALLLVGMITTVSIATFHASPNNGSSQFVNAAATVPVPGASVSASGTTGNVGSGSATANAQGQYT
ncbi:MAG TPA: hypothetical protein VK253_07775, partial [Candidatus Binatia bacterium]|nr:hypothetical protein [Candidatus Binatia bacterium]